MDPSGKLAGSPTAPGSSTFTVRASNGVNPAAVTGSITIVVPSNGPTVTSVTPSSAIVLYENTTQVTIRGAGFALGSTVHFGSVRAVVRSYSNDGTSLVAYVPLQAPGTVDVTVTANGVNSATSSADRFTYLDGRPVVTSVSPSSAIVLTFATTLVTIRGTGFTLGSSVRFGAVRGIVRSYSNDGTSLVVYVPVQAPGTVDVTVTGVGGTSVVSSVDQFTYLDGRPVVASVTPSSAVVLSPSSVLVTLHGTGFSYGSNVRFGTQNAFVRSVSADGTSLTVYAPVQSARTVDVVVSNYGGFSSVTPSDRFTYLAAAKPVITSLSSTTASSVIGALITVRGTGLSGVTAIYAGTTSGYVLMRSADGTSLTAYLRPHAAGTVDVTVTGPGGTSDLTSADRITFVGWSFGGFIFG